MNWLDALLLLPLLIGLIRGLMRGFITELIAILAVVLGVVGARLWGARFSAWILAQTTWPAGVCDVIAYALLSLTFVCGMTALIVALISRNPSLRQERMESLALLSRLFLTPAVTTLGIGIFVGAIWANVSWGQYWSWDPKETWALITWMVYATALHPGLVPTLNKPLHYHLFTLIAFATLLMTYFGVNYLLGGMPSYA